MAAPTFVTAGAGASSASATTLTPALPASRTNNNVILSFCFVNATGKTVTTATAGWTVGDSINTGGVSGAWAWRIVDGAETAAVWTWTGAAGCNGQEIQYTGNHATTPIDTNNKNSVDASITASVASLTTANDLCRILMVFSTSTVQTIPTPIDYTNRIGLNSVISTFVNESTTAANKAGAVGARSVAVTVANWTSFGIAIRGTGTGSTASERVSTSVQEVIENYSATTNPVRVSTSVQEVMENYSNPNNLRVSTSVLQVLRTVDIAAGFTKGYIF